jgi:hypothetical protein
VDLAVHAPTKAGLAVKPEHPWEPVIFMYNSLVKVNETDFRVYYDAIGCETPGSCDDLNGQRFVCVALSSDGRTFTKPDLGLVEYNGSKHNNIVFFEGRGKLTGAAPGMHVSFVPSMGFVGFNRRVFTSADGFSFRPLCNCSAATHPTCCEHLRFSDSQQVLLWDAAVDRFKVYFRTHQPQRTLPGRRKRSCPNGAPTMRSIGMLEVVDLRAPDWGPASPGR